MKLADERNLRFVSLQFTDIVGAVKSVQVPMHQLEEAVERGKWFDGSSIEGFARIAESDMFLVPDLDTFTAIPWEPGISADGAKSPTGSARVICDVFMPNGEPFA
ncbi:MAG TPA: glutamine synthetase, partial [Candidatus Limnocylindria bacterium]|nr:glutamine synthetase [Candidatus Limnocylindria bacterium]